MTTRAPIARRLMAAISITCAMFVLATAVAPAGAAFAGDGKQLRASGAGHTIIEGGTGGDTPVPVTTILAFHATESGGHFECLALAPDQAAGPDSGDFTTNVMYVTGPVTSLEVHGHRAVLRGTATVTGIGAGQDQPFTLTVKEGGPGATVVLEISGLVFREILLDGKITVN